MLRHLHVTSDLDASGAAGSTASLTISCRKNFGTAKRGVRAIREGMKVIIKQPGIGRPVEDIEPEFRE